MLLDEPLANLDYKLREELRDRVATDLRGQGHDLRLRHHGADGSAAARRQHGDAPSKERSRSLDRRPKSTARRRTRSTAQHLFRPADEFPDASRSRTARRRTDVGPSLRRTASSRSARRPLRGRLSPQSRVTWSVAAGPRGGQRRSSRSAKSPARKASSTSMCRTPAGSRWRAACTSCSRGKRLSSISIRQSFFVFDCRRQSGASTRSEGPPDDGPHRTQKPRAQLQARPVGSHRLGREADDDDVATTAAPTRCLARPGAARPRCSTSFPGW